jgi:hypothetical protein
VAAQEPADHAALHPTSGSWLNLVEVFFGIITRQAIRRGTFASVEERVTAISRFIDGWNQRCQPSTWTKTADQILPHAMRQRLQTRDTSGTNLRQTSDGLDGPEIAQDISAVGAAWLKASAVIGQLECASRLECRSARQRST